MARFILDDNLSWKLDLFDAKFYGDLHDDPEEYIDKCEDFWSMNAFSEVPWVVKENMLYIAKEWAECSPSSWGKFKKCLRARFGVEANEHAILHRLRSEKQTSKKRGSEFVFRKIKLAKRLDRIGYQLTEDSNTVKEVILLMKSKYKKALIKENIDTLEQLERFVLTMDFPGDFDVHNPKCPFDRATITEVKKENPFVPRGNIFTRFCGAYNQWLTEP